ncbi:MAG TPA: TonB family protein [Candidatus Dormibacteraeota bacterium]|nr:TonB family protein [Candidatus Dormibacteraeota bacterium]
MRGPFSYFLLSVALCTGGKEPCVQHLVVPGYPHLARQARLEGTVNVEVEIGSNGAVISTKASGANKLLQRAAEENLREWTFVLSAPASVSKRTIIFTYRLAGKEENYESSPVVILDLPCRVQITAHPPEPQPQ